MQPGTPRQRQQSSQLQSSQQSQSSQSTQLVSRLKQSQDERRIIRKEYRQLIQETANQKQELIQPGAGGLEAALEKSNTLYESVKFAREAALDSEFLSLASQFGVEQAHRLNTGFKSRDINEFVTKVRNRMRPSIDEQFNETENQNLEDMDWDTIGKKAIKCFKRTPSVTFMLGPLSATPPIRKERSQRKEREKLGKKVAPEQVTDQDDESDKLDKETSKKVEELRKHLDKAGHIEFFRLIMDPDSFGQTIENLFHFSFLIKDGQASMSLNDKGIPEIEPAQPPLSEDYSNGKAERKQCIVNLDFELWKKLKEYFGITKGVLPHREPREHRLGFRPIITQPSAINSQSSTTNATSNTHTTSTTTSNTSSASSNSNHISKSTANKKRKQTESSQQNGYQDSDSELERELNNSSTRKKQLTNHKKQTPLMEELDDEITLTDSRKKMLQSQVVNH